MKKLYFLLTLLLLLAGCSSENDLTSEVDQVAEARTNTESAIVKEIQFYTLLREELNSLEYVLDEFHSLTEKLYSLTYTGYNLKGYAEGQMTIDLLSRGLSETSSILLNKIESKNFLFEMSTMYNVSLEELESLYVLTLKVEQETIKAFDQMELHINTDHDQYYEVYNDHRDKVYDLMLEGKVNSLEQKGFYLDLIMDY